MAKITILGKPFGKQRPKASSYGGFTRIYTPKETINYETLVKFEYHNQSQEFFHADQPLQVSINCFYELPKSFSKKKRQEALDGKIFPLVKPDLDNVSKVILDALNKVAYEDDKQVVILKIKKHYAEQPKVEIEIKHVEVFEIE